MHILSKSDEEDPPLPISTDQLGAGLGPGPIPVISPAQLVDILLPPTDEQPSPFDNIHMDGNATADTRLLSSTSTIPGDCGDSTTSSRALSKSNSSVTLVPEPTHLEQKRADEAKGKAVFHPSQNKPVQPRVNLREYETGTRNGTGSPLPTLIDT